MDLVDIVQQVPNILHALHVDARKALQSTCRRLRVLVHSNSSSLGIGPALSTPATEARLLVHGEWRQLKVLSFRRAGLAAEAIAVISQGHWPLLKCLILSGNQIGTQGMENFSSQGAWPVLQVLQLRDVGMSEPMMNHLIDADLPRLSNLDLSCSSMEACISTLAKGNWPQLTRLVLSRSKLDSACMAQLVRGRWPKLTELDLSTNDMLSKAVGELKNATWPLLNTLNLDSAMLARFSKRSPEGREQQEQAFAALAQCEWHHLQVLNLTSCHVDPAAMHRLCQAQWQNLDCLDLTANFLHGDSLKFVVENQWSQLRCLDMKWCDIDITAVSYLVQAQWPCLELLGLSANDIHVEALEVLLQAKWPKLRMLDLSRNYLGPGAAVRLSGGHTLLLKSGRNVITPPAWLLNKWPRLLELDLSTCNVEF